MGVWKLPQTCSHKGCIRDVENVHDCCDAHSKCPECGRSKFLKFAQEPYKCMACGARWEDWPHVHDWHRNGTTQVVCLGCGAREERPAPELPPTVQRTCVDCGKEIAVPLDELCPQCPSCPRERAAPELPPIGSRWQYRNSDRIGDVCEVVEKVGNTVANPGEVLLRYGHAAAFHVSLEQLREQYVRVESCVEPRVEGLSPIRIEGNGLRLSGDAATMERTCSVCHKPIDECARDARARAERAAIIRSRQAAHPTGVVERARDLATEVHVRAEGNRAAGKALVDVAALTPPPGVHPRAWRAALMALEEFGHGHDHCLVDTDIDAARVLLEVYERERGR